MFHDLQMGCEFSVITLRLIFHVLVHDILAFFGFTPEGAKRSFWIFHVYFSYAVELEFDDKTFEPLKSTWTDVIQSARDVIFNMGFNSVLTSFMSAHGFKPFGLCHAGKFYDGFRVSEYLDPRHLGNCFLIAGEFYFFKIQNLSANM